MAYSKLFLGNLPELICEIIQYFRNDLSTLYSCILVNKLWCRLAIPLLWEDPFSSTHVQNFQFIEIYLCNLNEDDRTKFNEYVNQLVNMELMANCKQLVNMELIANCSSTLFNYSSFIKRLNTHKVAYSIENWLMDDKHWENYPSFIELITKNLLIHLEISILVYRLLFKMFIENEGNLHSFEVEVRTYDDRTKHVEKWLTQMINTQQNLKKISFEQNNFLYYSFSSLKNSNISNTLKIITFYIIDFKEIINNIQEIFNQLNVLETIHIIYCYSLNSDFVQQIINVIRPFKLKSLIMNQILLNVELLQLLIQKFGSDLENFGFGHYKLPIQKKQQLFKLIIKYCRKIKYFSLIEPNYNNINPTLSLIENINQNLNYLDIKFECYYDYYDDSSIGQILPSKLGFLKLEFFSIKPSKLLKIFLGNSQNTLIKRLFIKITVQEEVKDILPHIKEYIMKKKRAKYLAIFINNQDLVSLKDEVKEFELYNIKVQKYDEYDESYIRVIDIVNN
ncbi:uncharacterized protein OCT59_002220 [Rhizophagus irregularis]|uniref:uncharacterized protein n=1 Tax=Rhizophagus irregularis TaxID=588596 RepID=UPI0033337E04|nr:hypothetical protein OCT59_002220 [Rhizophagus irregularis]